MPRKKQNRHTQQSKQESDIVFPLECMKAMEKKYPHVLEQELNSEFDLAMHGIELRDYDLMFALQQWKKDKIIYNFEDKIAYSITTQTAAPDYKISSTFLRLPFPCIAVKLLPVELFDGSGQSTVDSYSGKAFIWIKDNRLYSSWELLNGNYDLFSFALEQVTAMDDAYDIMVREKLSNCGYSDPDLILKLLRVERFADIFGIDSKQRNRLSYKFGDKGEYEIIAIIRKVAAHEALLHRVIYTILYLNCTNADIEAAEEKLKEAALASTSSLDGHKPASKTKRQQVLNLNKDAKIMDVGYRTAGKFKRSYSDVNESVDEEDSAISGTRTQYTQGYSKRRAHTHHFWIGPRNGPIAEDIMNPQPGERGLIMYWLEATEIHPELKNDLATVVGVQEEE